MYKPTQVTPELIALLEVKRFSGTSFRTQKELHKITDQPKPNVVPEVQVLMRTLILRYLPTLGPSSK